VIERVISSCPTIVFIHPLVQSSASAPQLSVVYLIDAPSFSYTSSLLQIVAYSLPISLQSSMSSQNRHGSHSYICIKRYSHLLYLYVLIIFLVVVLFVKIRLLTPLSLLSVTITLVLQRCWWYFLHRCDLPNFLVSRCCLLYHPHFYALYT